MYDHLRVGDNVAADFSAMFDELGEPAQVLRPDSPRPLVVHRVMGQMTFVWRGEGLALLAGDQVSLHAGDLLVLAPGCAHAFMCRAGELELRHWHWPQALLDQDRYILVEEQGFDLGPRLADDGGAE